MCLPTVATILALQPHVKKHNSVEQFYLIDLYVPGVGRREVSFRQFYLNYHDMIFSFFYNESCKIQHSIFWSNIPPSTYH